MSATGAFATIILERLLDLVTVLMLLALYVFVFDRQLALTNPQAIVWLKWIGAMAGVGALAALVVLFVLAGDPERLRRTLERLAHVVPSTLAGLVARVAEKFARGLGAIRRPGRLLVALLWSFPLWLSIAAGIWAAAVAFQIAMPFSDRFSSSPCCRSASRFRRPRRRRLSHGVSLRCDVVLRRATMPPSPRRS
jgi:hypothetical protein